MRRWSSSLDVIARKIEPESSLSARRRTLDVSSLGNVTFKDT